MLPRAVVLVIGVIVLEFSHGLPGTTRHQHSGSRKGRIILQLEGFLVGLFAKDSVKVLAQPA